jgi:hypothetical protein
MIIDVAGANNGNHRGGQRLRQFTRLNEEYKSVTRTLHRPGHEPVALAPGRGADYGCKKSLLLVRQPWHRGIAARRIERTGQRLEHGALPRSRRCSVRVGAG